MKIVEGSCHCGECSYQITSEKQFEFLCHCSDCRVIHSGGHLSGIIFKEDSFSIKGELSQYSYAGGSGKNIDSYFCKKCGTSVYAKPIAHEGIVVVRANTLKDSSIFSPAQSLFPENAFPWDKSTIK